MNRVLCFELLCLHQCVGFIKIITALCCLHPVRTTNLYSNFKRSEGQACFHFHEDLFSSKSNRRSLFNLKNRSILAFWFSLDEKANPEHLWTCCGAASPPFTLSLFSYPYSCDCVYYIVTGMVEVPIIGMFYHMVLCVFVFF